MKRRQNFHLDRAKTCPFLLKVYPKINGEHSLKQFSNPDKDLLSDEINLYTWMDANLKEIADLLKEFIPQAKQKDATLEFNIVYRSTHTGEFNKKQIGVVQTIGKCKDDLKKLNDFGMKIGDFLDINIRVKGEN